MGVAVTEPRTLHLHASSVTLDGEGEMLTFKLSACRVLKTGRRESIALELETTRFLLGIPRRLTCQLIGKRRGRLIAVASKCRHSIKELAAAIDEMQTRDRARIDRQISRLSSELKPLQRP